MSRAIGHIACIMDPEHVQVYAVWHSTDFPSAIERCFQDGAREVVTEWKGHYYVCEPQEAGTYRRTEVAPGDPRTVYIPALDTVRAAAPRR